MFLSLLLGGFLWAEHRGEGEQCLKQNSSKSQIIKMCYC